MVAQYLTRGAAALQIPALDSNKNWTQTTITASGTAHTKGAWSQLVASTSGDVTGLLFFNTQGTNTNAADTSTLVDIGVGAAASEVVLVADMQYGFSVTSRVKYLPVHLPAGVRIAARSQSAVTSKAFTAICVPLIGEAGAPGLGSLPCGFCTTYGTQAAASAGTTLTPATNNWGAWVELSSSTTAAIHALDVSVGLAQRTGVTARRVHLQLGVGAASSEAAVWATDLIVGPSESVDVSIGGIAPAVLGGPTIPAGSRLVARVASATTSDTVDVSVHGFTF